SCTANPNSRKLPCPKHTHTHTPPPSPSIHTQTNNPLPTQHMHIANSPQHTHILHCPCKHGTERWRKRKRRQASQCLASRGLGARRAEPAHVLVAAYTERR